MLSSASSTILMMSAWLFVSAPSVPVKDCIGVGRIIRIHGRGDDLRRDKVQAWVKVCEDEEAPERVSASTSMTAFKSPSIIGSRDGGELMDNDAECA
jgi:hypothetical protein